MQINAILLKMVPKMALETKQTKKKNGWRKNALESQANRIT